MPQPKCPFRYTLISTPERIWCGIWSGNWNWTAQTSTFGRLRNSVIRMLFLMQVRMCRGFERTYKFVCVPSVTQLAPICSSTTTIWKPPKASFITSSMMKSSNNIEMGHRRRTPNLVSNELDSLPYTLTRPEVCEYHARKRFTNFIGSPFPGRAFNSAAWSTKPKKPRLSHDGASGALRVTHERIKLTPQWLLRLLLVPF